MFVQFQSVVSIIGIMEKIIYSLYVVNFAAFLSACFTLLFDYSLFYIFIYELICVLRAAYCVLFSTSLSFVQVPWSRRASGAAQQ